MLLIGTKNTNVQNVLTNGIINIGTTYRKYCKKNCGVKTFDTNSNSISLQTTGMYKVTISAIVSSTETGDVVLGLYENGQAINGAIATETISTATTEFRTMVIDYYILVDSSRVLNANVTNTKVLTLVNTGIPATINNLVINVLKVV